MYKPLQGVKLFDPQFISIYLKNVLRCPKCQSAYIDNNEVGSKLVRNSMPFLLPCGHNMCESCLQQNHPVLVCAVCRKPAEAIKEAKGNRKGNRLILDYYDINYYILGNLRNMQFFGCFDPDSLSMSVTSDKSKEIAVERKCSECEILDIEGQCYECNAYYCTNCFDTVHLHSKVLTCHTFIKSKNGHVNKYVGEGISEIPKPSYACNVDKKQKGYCCLHCRNLCGTKCALQYYESHKVKTSQEVNDYTLEISSLLVAVQNVETSLLNSKRVC